MTWALDRKPSQILTLVTHSCIHGTSVAAPFVIDSSWLNSSADAGCCLLLLRILSTLSFRRVQALLAPVAKDAFFSGQSKSMSKAMSSTLNVFKWSGHVFNRSRLLEALEPDRHQETHALHSRSEQIGHDWTISQIIGRYWERMKACGIFCVVRL